MGDNTSTTTQYSPLSHEEEPPTYEEWDDLPPYEEEMITKEIPKPVKKKIDLSDLPHITDKEIKKTFNSLKTYLKDKISCYEIAMYADYFFRSRNSFDKYFTWRVSTTKNYEMMEEVTDINIDNWKVFKNEHLPHKHTQFWIVPSNRVIFLET